MLATMNVGCCQWFLKCDAVMPPFCLFSWRSSHTKTLTERANFLTFEKLKKTWEGGKDTGVPASMIYSDELIVEAAPTHNTKKIPSISTSMKVATLMITADQQKVSFSSFPPVFAIVVESILRQAQSR